MTNQPNPSFAYEKLILFCTNMRQNNRRCCGIVAGDIAKEAKNFLAREGVGTEADVRVTSTGCLGRCMHGPMMVVFPDNLWFSYSSADEVLNILRTYVLDAKHSGK